MDPGISFEILLNYNTTENERWKGWFARNAAALDLPCDVAGAGTVRKVLLHIFATELVFACLVLDQARPDFENLQPETLDELFAISADARAKYDQFLLKATPEDWTTPHPMGFRDLKTSKAKMIMQAMWHSVNHRGQLATFLRQHGLKQDWIHDFLLSNAME
jgi:uncharacterized damage-inducible protein DinB